MASEASLKRAEILKTEACDCEANTGRKKSGQGSYKRFYCGGCLAVALDEARAEGEKQRAEHDEVLAGVIAKTRAEALKEGAERERWGCHRLVDRWAGEKIAARGRMRGPEEE